MTNLLKKHTITLGAILLLGGVLTACNDAPEINGENSEAKTGENATKKVDAKPEKEEEKEADIWTYYDDANWSDDFNGLQMEIQKVVVTENAPTAEDEGAEESAVGMKFRMENTTDHKFEAYPDQATLVTSTGEQIEADMFLSDNIGGEIDKGVIKEGDVLFYLERGEAEAVEWVKFEWFVTDVELDESGDYDNSMKTIEVELELNK